MKNCSKCLCYKSIKEFNKNSRSKDGLDYFCRDCHKKRMKTVNKNSYANNRPKQMLRSYLKFDEKNGLQFDLDEEWFKTNIENQPCYYCSTTEDKCGCDRLDNSLGHTKSNCVPCCQLCNVTRNNNFTPKEMLELGVIIANIRQNRKNVQASRL